MIRGRLKQLSGRTLNTALSPDLSIAQGATYYAGMLLAHDKFARSILNEDATERLAQVKQQSVNARDLGILVRDMPTQTRIPHYLIPPNTPLPTAATQQFGTVVPNQKRVHLVIVESGTDPDQPYVVLGDCKIDGLPPNLPEGSKIDVTISYDPQARVHVSAKDAASGKSAATEILRQENIVAQLTTRSAPRAPTRSCWPDKIPANPFKPAPEAAVEPQTDLSDEKWTAFFEQKAAGPVALCNDCGTPLGANGKCPRCSAKAGSTKAGSIKPGPGKVGPAQSSSAQSSSAPIKARSPVKLGPVKPGPSSSAKPAPKHRSPPLPPRSRSRPSRHRPRRTKFKSPPPASQPLRRNGPSRISPPLLTTRGRMSSGSSSASEPGQHAARPYSPEGGRQRMAHLGGGVGCGLAAGGLAGAPKSDFCSGGFLGASDSQPIVKPARARMAKSARDLRIVLISFARDRQIDVRTIAKATAAALGRESPAFYSPKNPSFRPRRGNGNWTSERRLPTLDPRAGKDANRPVLPVRSGPFLRE